MAAGQRQRREYTDAFKKKAVERILAERISIMEFCEEKDVAESVVRRWVRDPRYGGKPGAFTNGKTSAKAHGGLPTKAANGKGVYKRSKRPVPLTWACPHCNGPLLIGEER